MNRNLSVPGPQSWPLGPHGALPVPENPGQRDYSPTNILDLQTVLRIIQHWRWLILGAMAAGLALGIF